MNIGTHRGKQSQEILPAREIATKTDAARIRLVMGVYRFRIRHPWVYGLIAFIIGSALLGIFTMSTYSNWTFEGINLKLALYQVVSGALGGGIVAVVLAFAYSRAMGPVVALRDERMAAGQT